MGIVRQKLSIKQILHLKSYNPNMKFTPENQKTYDDFIAKQNAFVTPKKVKKIKQDLIPTETGEIDFEEVHGTSTSEPVFESSVPDKIQDESI